MGPITGLDDLEKRKFLTLPGLEIRTFCRVHSQSLYRLSYPGSPLPEEESGQWTNVLAKEKQRARKRVFVCVELTLCWHPPR
jgi:hypothetical protein